MRNTLSYIALVLATATFTSCDDFTKPHSASFTVDGVNLQCNADNVTAGYYNGSSQFLQVTAISDGSPSHSVTILVDLDHVNHTVQVDSAAAGFSYLKPTSSIQYIPLSGVYQITEHEEGNPASRHTQGTFSLTVINPYDVADTIRITEGNFYVNNY